MQIKHPEEHPVDSEEKAIEAQVQIKHPEEHPVDSEEKATKAQVPSPKSKAELALIIEQKLNSFYSKPPETELDENPRRKYVIDLTTNKKYVYDNLKRGEFAFTDDGGLSLTVFYSELSGNIPQAELGTPTADFDYHNRLHYSNVEYLRSETDQQQGGLHDCPDDLGVDHGLQGVQGPSLPDDTGDQHQGDQQGDQGEHPGAQHHDQGQYQEDSDNSNNTDQDTSSQQSEDEYIFDNFDSF